MKLFASLLLALFCGTTLHAQTNDTIVYINDVRQVLISQKDSTVSINLHGTATDPNYRFNYQISQHDAALIEAKASKWNFSAPLLTLGESSNKKRSSSKHRQTKFYVVVDPALLMGMGNVSNHQFSSRWEGNWDIDLHLLGARAVFYDHHIFSFNLGYGWGKYVMDASNYLHVAEGKVNVGPYPEGTYPGRSVARFNRWIYQFRYNYKFYGPWSLWAGVQLNSHIRPRIYNTYHVKEKKVSTTHKSNLHLRSHTFSYLAGLNYHNLGIYVKYTPKSAFEQGFGPQGSMLTLGLSLNVR